MSKARVELYYANWCGHCKNFKPTWEKFKNAVSDKIKCKQYEESEYGDLMRRKGIHGFPTIRIIVGNNVEEYNGKRDYDTFYNYVMNKLDNQTNIINDKKNDDIKITLYYAEWCGYCKEFKPIWEQLKKAFDDNNIKHEEYESDMNKDIIERENIRGFPTIKISGNGETETYKGERSFEKLFTLMMNKMNKSTEEIKNSIEKYMKQEGGRKNKNFYEKYMKYKAKYLKLRKEKNKKKK
jgi:thiol-disulfide isomerase/thioredoxin